MRSIRLLVLSASAAGLLMAGSASVRAGSGTPAGVPVTVALDAHFDDKPLDQPIGTGGAAVGEPIYVSPVLDAIVRSGAEPGQRLLELANPGGASAISTRFEFLDDAEYTSGTLHLELVLVLDEAANHGGVQVNLRERGGSARSFLDVLLRPNGTLFIGGSGFGQVSVPGVVGPGVHRLELLADLDGRRIRVWFDDTPYGPSEGFQHDIEDRGIGRVVVGLVAHPGPRRAWIDRIGAGHQSGDPLFADGFESTD